MSNYFQDTINELSARLDDCDPDLLRLYALLALTTGEDTTLEHVHDAWSGWRNSTKPDHQSLVWFDELTPEIQEYDRKYQQAIREVAAGLKRPLAA